MQPELEGIHTNAGCHLVDHLFKRPGALRMARCAEGPGRAGVDEHVFTRGAYVIAEIEVAYQPVDQLRHFCRIGAAGSGTVKLEGGDGAVLFDPGLELHAAGRPVADTQVGLFPAEQQFYRTRAFFCQQDVDERIFSRPELAAETTAHVVIGNPYLRQLLPVSLKAY